MKYWDWNFFAQGFRRSSHEERGLKYKIQKMIEYLYRRSSHEERGLKSFTFNSISGTFASLLSRGAWIEISARLCERLAISRRSSHEERGLKFIDFIHYIRIVRSLLSRGAWIEILYNVITLLTPIVAPLTRSVD